MDRRAFLAACSGLMSFAIAGRAGEPSQVDIQRLVEQLSSRKFAEREAASQTLKQLDSAAMPALRKAAKQHADAEVRRQATVLVNWHDERPMRECRRRVQQVMQSGLSPSTKAQKLSAMFPPGMAQARVIQLLGPAVFTYGWVPPGGMGASVPYSSYPGLGIRFRYIKYQGQWFVRRVLVDEL